MVGGPRNKYLYSTKDSGQHWVQQALPSPRQARDAIRIEVGLPVFSDAAHALLSARFVGRDYTSTIANYSTADAGNSWQLLTTYASIPARVRAVAASAGSGFVTVLVDAGKLQVRVGDGSGNVSPLAGTTQGNGIAAVRFADALHGWIELTGTQCTGFKTGCSAVSTLVKTDDGGVTITPLFTFRGQSIGSAALARSPSISSVKRAGTARPDLYGAGVNTLINAYGIDTCEEMAPSNMGSIWNTTGNTVLGFYLGGAIADATCFEPDGAWIYNVACYPWTYMPVWDDLQPSCMIGGTQHPINSSTASASGVAAANNAISALVNLGLPNSIAYLDIENYALGNQQCSTDVRNYLGAFVSQMHSQGYSAGVYANGANAYYDMTEDQIANFPDAVWVPQYPGPGEAVSPLYTLDNDGVVYWTDNERIHQVAQGVLTGLTNPSRVDTDFIDGYTAAPLYYSACDPGCTDICDDSCPDYDPSQCGGDSYSYSCDDGCTCYSDDGSDCCCDACGCDEAVPIKTQPMTRKTQARRVGGVVGAHDAPTLSVGKSPEGN